MAEPGSYYPDLSTGNTRMVARGGELLSTDQFYQELAKVSFSGEGLRILTYGVDMDPETMSGALTASDELELIASSDGLVSHVRENPGAHAADNSGSSRFFSLHTDGQYLPTIPETVVLYCVNPGTSEIPTVFVDTKDILDGLRGRGLLREAEDYEHVFKNKHGHSFTRPLLELSPENNEPVMNVAIASSQCHLRPIEDSRRTQQAANVFYNLLQEIVEQDITPREHRWSANDAIVFDNQRLIHGRGRLDQKSLGISDAERHLLRIWVRRR